MTGDELHFLIDPELIGAKPAVLTMLKVGDLAMFVILIGLSVPADRRSKIGLNSEHVVLKFSDGLELCISGIEEL